jgi:hypothetical protein
MNRTNKINGITLRLRLKTTVKITLVKMYKCWLFYHFGTAKSYAHIHCLMELALAVLISSISFVSENSFFYKLDSISIFFIQNANVYYLIILTKFIKGNKSSNIKIFDQTFIFTDLRKQSTARNTEGVKIIIYAYLW